MDKLIIGRVKVVIEGQVQGVGFRHFTMKHAVQFNLTGWVFNSVDGRVITEAEGHRSSVEDFIDVLRKGPLMSSVTNMEITWIEASGQDSNFHIRQ